ncbi:RNA methyltransferase [bacterium]|nr:RNA methyltransferase [bacterium]
MTARITPERHAKLDVMAANRQRDLVIVLEDIHDPHNAEAVFRSCDGFGVQTAHLIFQEQPPFNPRKVGKSTSSSANKWLDFETYRSTISAIERLKSDGYTLVGTTLREDAVSLYEADFSTGKWAIWVGNEHRGLSDIAHQHLDMAVTIPMAGLVQSFNLSVTAAIMLFEVTRQRYPRRSEFLVNATEHAELMDRLVSRSRPQSTPPKLTPGSVPVLGQFGGVS